MMKKEKILIFGVVLTLFVCSLASCLDDDNTNKNVLQFLYEPVLIQSDGGENVMKTQYGNILAPQLSQAKQGEYYLTHFLMDTIIRPYTAYAMEYKRMGADTLHASSGAMPAEYESPISDVKIYIRDGNANDLLKPESSNSGDMMMAEFICTDSTFFILPEFEGSEKDLAHEFEFISGQASDVDPEYNLPVFYLRAKTTTENIATKGYALNLSTILKSPEYVGAGAIEFNLKFKTGVDSEGIDVYKDYKNNPVKLRINNNQIVPH
ncbi:MAG: hypothetical protein LBJ72_06330 [Dysgonamonadaceae bacterium]|jgi:hypothetical protein|nr:hypothetical protein [Dysgonamonadaceae bacterium]